MQADQLFTFKGKLRLSNVG